MNNRHHAREVAFQILYQWDIQGCSTEPAEKELKEYFEHFTIPVEIQNFSKELIHGVIAQIKTLDHMIESKAKHWKITRMSTVDRNVLRLGTFELMDSPDIPLAIIIDEAIELAKKFGGENSTQFVNGILDAIAQAIAQERSTLKI